MVDAPDEQCTGFGCLNGPPTLGPDAGHQYRRTAVGSTCWSVIGIKADVPRGNAVQTRGVWVRQTCISTRPTLRGPAARLTEQERNRASYVIGGAHHNDGTCCERYGFCDRTQYG